MEMIYKVDFVEVVEVIIRSLLSLATLFIATKIIGKKQVSELSLFDYVIGISIGNFSAEISLSNDIQYVNAFVAVMVFGIISYLVSLWSLKSMRMRRFFLGKPTMLIQEGHIIRKNLKKVRMNVNELLQQCRTNGNFDLNEIEYAIMESNGQISILPKAIEKPVTPKDMQLKVDKSYMCADVIIDGKIIINNLLNMNKDKAWLLKELKVKGYNDCSGILLATLDPYEKLTIYEDNRNLEVRNILE